MKISAFYIYPIKSLQGIAVQSAEVLQKGFQYDRRWMLIDEEGKQLTQRTHSQLSQIKIELKNESIVASHEGFAPLQIPLQLKQGNPLSAIIWGDKVEGWSYSPVADKWFSEVSRTTCRLVYMPESARRSINSEYAKQQETVSFADGHPYLIIGENSLADLNQRLGAPIPMNRFRPNIVFEGGAAYVEDHWSEFKIGDISFYGGHPCVRCVFTTIDQETGQKGKEPLTTLATYRNTNKGVIFGINAIALCSGSISRGDTLEII